MRIGELAARTGVSVRALRYYEEQHLLSSERSPSGQRHYSHDAVDRVLLIQQLYAAGLPSKSIVELLPCVVTAEVNASAWLLRSRRLIRDYERRTDTSEAVIRWSMIALMNRRLAARPHRPAALSAG
ncbi:MerR family transcriptional regulator [Streptomyces sp. NPDC003233]